LPFLNMRNVPWSTSNAKPTTSPMFHPKSVCDGQLKPVESPLQVFLRAPSKPHPFGPSPEKSKEKREPRKEKREKRKENPQDEAKKMNRNKKSGQTSVKQVSNKCQQVCSQASFKRQTSCNKQDSTPVFSSSLSSLPTPVESLTTLTPLATTPI